MTTEIEVTEGSASPPAKVLVQDAQAGGWLAWYRTNSQSTWSMVYDNNSANKTRDSYRCPYPLFATKEEAIEAGKQCFYGAGGELSLVRVLV
jgi:hypothetical protein